MYKLNLKKSLVPIKIKQKIFFDKRGFFQEIFLKKNFNLNIKFTAIAKSKKKCSKRFAFSIKEQTNKIITYY